ncbi:serine hydrolase [Streptomyces sp. NPDC051976]|uniref:serine hydrolase n=1 Tax=Streptomyces sp. NPDC051976 TaxID=3154947 RepID=UPI00343C595F
MDDEWQPREGEEPIVAGPWDARGTRGARWWVRPTLVSFTALAAMAVLTLATVVQSPSAHGDAGSAPTGASATPTPSATVTPRVTVKPSATETAPKATATVTPRATKAAPATGKSPQRAVAAAVADLAGETDGNLAVAVTDAGGSGAAAVYDSAAGGGHTYDTASIVKVDILAALLLQDQRAGTLLTAGQRRLADAMIESSDNDAATALWDTIGGAAGLDAVNDTLGLAHTDGGSGELWGLTQTTAADQLALLRAVFGDHSALSAASRAYVASLMGAVDADQNWGVSAADSAAGGGFALKNGWLRRTATGLWDINSVGRISYAGHTLLICVLSDGRPSEEAGISLVERAAVAAARAYGDAAGWE